jgi:hypothetical protein
MKFHCEIRVWSLGVFDRLAVMFLGFRVILQ